MPDSPNWLFIVNIFGWAITFLLGLVVTMVKMENARQDRRITMLENKYLELNNLVLGKYVDRDYLNGIREDLVHRLETLNTKLDVVIMERRQP